MDNEKKTITFVEGIDHIKKINDTFFYLKINVEEFHKWADEHKKENGCVYINLCQSKSSDMWYPKLSTYTGKQLNQMEYDDYKKKQAEKESEEKLPF